MRTPPASTRTSRRIALWTNGLYGARLRRKMGSAESVREADRLVLKARRGRGESTDPYDRASLVTAGDWR